MAIDKDTMLTTVYGGQGKVADSLIPPGMPGHQDGIGLKYDVAGAKTELAQALTELGYAKAADVPPLSFGFNTNAGHELPSAYMQNQWRTNLGIQSTLVGETFDQFLVDRPAGKFSIARNAWGADYPHPDNWLRALFQSQSGNNDSLYKNPQYDDLVAQGRRRAGSRRSRSPCTTRPSSCWSRTHPRSSPGGASATTRSSRTSRASRALPRTPSSSATTSTRTSRSRSTRRHGRRQMRESASSGSRHIPGPVGAYDRGHGPGLLA